MRIFGLTLALLLLAAPAAATTLEITSGGGAFDAAGETKRRLVRRRVVPELPCDGVLSHAVPVALVGECQRVFYVEAGTHGLPVRLARLLKCYGRALSQLSDDELVRRLAAYDATHTTGALAASTSALRAQLGDQERAS